MRQVKRKIRGDYKIVRKGLRKAEERETVDEIADKIYEVINVTLEGMVTDCINSRVKTS